MTPLRQRMIEDMRIRNFATTTQRSYIHYVAEFAKHFNRSPRELDLEAVRQYQLHLTQERKLSPQSINTFVSAVQFLYLTTLEMPWEKQDFPRARLDEKLPVVLAPDEVQRFLDHIASIKHRAVPVELLRRRPAHFRSRRPPAFPHRQPADAHPCPAR